MRMTIKIMIGMMELITYMITTLNVSSLMMTSMEMEAGGKIRAVSKDLALGSRTVGNKAVRPFPC